MAFQYNSTTVKALTYKGNDVKRLIYNGSVAWCKPFTLTIRVSGSEYLTNYSVSRTSSEEPTASISTLSNGDTIYYGDSLTASATASSGVSGGIDKATVSGVGTKTITISNPNNFTVTLSGEFISTTGTFPLNGTINPLGVYKASVSGAFAKIRRGNVTLNVADGINQYSYSSSVSPSSCSVTGNTTITITGTQVATKVYSSETTSF